jgi:hypothetical protein
MSSRKLTQQDLDAVHAFAKQWGKIIVRRAFGDHGPDLDTDLDTMEQLALAAARGLTAGTLEQATTLHAQRLPEQLPCPACGLLCTVHHEDRNVSVRGGATFCHHEPVAHCTACRRAFFPSTPSAAP